MFKHHLATQHYLPKNYPQRKKKEPSQDEAGKKDDKKNPTWFSKGKKK